MHVRGNIVDAMVAYAEGRLGEPRVPLDQVTRIIAIGSDRMMNAVKAARLVKKNATRLKLLGDGEVKAAIVVLRHHVDAPTARTLLLTHDGSVRRALEALAK